MNKIRLLAAAFMAGAIAFPALVHARGPSFNCAKAQGEVEKLICSDASLTKLDHKLKQTYKAATAKAKGQLAAQLRTEQRGWIKGRNDCWKANGQPTWITATWTVDTVRGCIDAQYRLRISELQSVWQLLAPKTLTYVCGNLPANELVVNLFDTDPATIRLERGDRTVTMWLVGTASEKRYEGQNVSLKDEGNAVKVSWLNTDTGQTEVLQCQAR